MLIIILLVIIFGVGLRGLYVCFAVRRKFVKENENLSNLVGLIPNSQNPQDLFQNAVAALPNDSHVLIRVRAIRDISSRGQLPNIQELSELSVASEESTSHSKWLMFVLSVLLILGLGGTFLAFREILAGIDDDPANAVQEVSKIYGGLSSAFLASMAGLFGTVVLLFFKFVRVDTVRDRFFSELDTISVSELVPRFAQLNLGSEKSLSDISVSLQALVAGLSPASQDMKESAEQARQVMVGLNLFSNNLKAATDRFGEFSAKDSPFITAIGKLFDAVVKSKSDYSEHQKQVAELVANIGKQNELLSTTQTSFVELHTTFENIHKQLAVDFTQLQQNFETAMTSMAKGYEKETLAIFSSSNELLSKLDKLIQEATAAENVHLANLAQTSTDLKTSVEAFRSDTSTIVSKISSLDKLEVIATDMKALAEANYARVLNDLNAYVGSLNTLTKNIETSLREGEVSKADIIQIQNSLRTINQTLANKKFKLSVFGS